MAEPSEDKRTVHSLAKDELRTALERFSQFQNPASPLTANHRDLRDAAETIWYLARTVKAIGSRGL